MDERDGRALWETCRIEEGQAVVSAEENAAVGGAAARFLMDLVAGEDADTQGRTVFGQADAGDPLQGAYPDVSAEIFLNGEDVDVGKTVFRGQVEAPTGRDAGHAVPVTAHPDASPAVPGQGQAGEVDILRFRADFQGFDFQGPCIQVADAGAVGGEQDAVLHGQDGGYVPDGFVPLDALGLGLFPTDPEQSFVGTRPDVSVGTFLQAADVVDVETAQGDGLVGADDRLRQQGFEGQPEPVIVVDVAHFKEFAASRQYAAQVYPVQPPGGTVAI